MSDIDHQEEIAGQTYTLYRDGTLEFTTEYFDEVNGWGRDTVSFSSADRQRLRDLLNGVYRDESGFMFKKAPKV